MNKTAFIKVLNEAHAANNKEVCIACFSDITRLSARLGSDIISNLWGCSDSKNFGKNVYNLLEASSSEDSAITFNPKLKKGCTTMYYMYLDEHTAAFALFKISKYKP